MQRDTTSSARGTARAAVRCVGQHPRQHEAFDARVLALLADLHGLFDARRAALLRARATRQVALDAGSAHLGFRQETAALRAADWSVAPIPKDLLRRRVEITGPVDDKRVIQALTSGADCFMADFEDATAPTWANLVEGQLALRAAVQGTLAHTDARTGKQYALNGKLATLLARPRGLHLDDAHLVAGEQPLAGMFVDLAAYLTHNAAALLDQGKTPALYIPKLERYEEALLVDDVLAVIEQSLGLPDASVKVTVLIETLPAAFEMQEILHALRRRIVGLNCGRWDFIFSSIKRRRMDARFVCPDRGQMTMDRSFLQSYAALLVQTCHRRGALAIGGMSAFIPVKDDAAKNDAAMAKVRADKEREVRAGHDGTWVAHPGLVQLAQDVFQTALGDAPNQLHVMRDDVNVTAADLLNTPEGTRTTEGLRHNLRIGVHYLASWLNGQGCVPIDNLMEDAATAEIARMQVWQWHKHAVVVGDSVLTTARLHEELAAAVAAVQTATALPTVPRAAALFGALLVEELPTEFLTLPAYPFLLHTDAPA